MHPIRRIASFSLARGGPTLRFNSAFKFELYWVCLSSILANNQEIFMKCPVCQAKLKPSAIFCDTCGNKLAKDAEPTLFLSASENNSGAKQNSQVPLILGGLALLLIGVLVGASFFSSAPAPVPRETVSEVAKTPPPMIIIKEEAPVVAKETPIVPSSPVEEPTSGPIKATQDGQLVNPFTKKKKVEAPSEDTTLNPFANKPAAPINANTTLSPFRPLPK
jgi:hypothetical protein